MDGKIQLDSNESNKREPHSYESALMLEDGSLEITTTQYLPDGGHTSGRIEIAPTDDAFELFILRHGQLKPGQFHNIIKDWVNGTWVERPSEGIQNLGQ
jgi:hypothetical protein